MGATARGRAGVRTSASTPPHGQRPERLRGPSRRLQQQPERHRGIREINVIGGSARATLGSGLATVTTLKIRDGAGATVRCAVTTVDASGGGPVGGSSPIPTSMAGRRLRPTRTRRTPIRSTACGVRGLRRWTRAATLLLISSQSDRPLPDAQCEGRITLVSVGTRWHLRQTRVFSLKMA
jgi:hypothetical protein